MILDSRIKAGKKPLTCLDVEQAWEFVGKECIFSDFCINYLDIEKFNIDNDNEHTGILSIDDNSSDYIFINTRNKSRYRFILPCEWVKESEKYRPYTVMEFIEEYPLGSHVHFRPKGGTMEMHRLIDGYNDCKNGAGTLFMCGALYSMSELYDNYEIYRNGTWEPFGKN